jgi:predicted NBD/HSP70 family sugar kinase
MFAERRSQGSAIDIGRSNAAAVLRSLLHAGPLARTEVAEVTGLTRATVTRATSKLIDAGIVVEQEPIRAVGRPMVPIEIQDELHVVLAVHIGATVTRLGLVDVRGRILLERKLPHSSTEPDALVADVCGHALALVGERDSGVEVLGVGASIGGWVDTEHGDVVRYAPLGWTDVPLAAMLGERLGLPVFFDQMVRGMALSEMMFGSARGVRDFVQIYIGHVLGAAFVEGGVIRRGPRGAAGSIDHIAVSADSRRTCSCGRLRCLQCVATDPAVREDAVLAGLLAEGGSIADLTSRTEDPATVAFLDERAGALGEAAAVLVDFVNPSLVLVAGPQTHRAGFLDTFSDALFSRSEHGRGLGLGVQVSGFGDSIPTTASAALCLDSYYRDPLGYTETRSALAGGSRVEPTPASTTGPVVP